MPARPVWLVPVLGLLLAGCTGASGEPPKTLPPVSPSPSASASPSAVAVEVPAEARAETPQGAAAFARFYLSALDAAGLSGEFAALQQYSSEKCATCQALISAIRRDWDKGLRITGGETVVLAAEAMPRGDLHLVDVVYNVSTSTVRDGSGAVLRTRPPRARLSMQIGVARVGQGWAVRAIRYGAVSQ